MAPGGRVVLTLADGKQAVALGPGLGAEPETLGPAGEIVRNTNTPLLLDADALAEQAQGKGNELGPASDTYSLGAILYELKLTRSQLTPPLQH